MPLLPEILLSLLPVLIIAGLALWQSPRLRLSHWRRWVRELPEHHHHSHDVRPHRKETE